MYKVILSIHTHVLVHAHSCFMRGKKEKHNAQLGASSLSFLPKHNEYKEMLKDKTKTDPAI